MMKKITLLFAILLLCDFANAQEKPLQLYNPEIDAAEQVKKAVAAANSSGKHVLLQIGGNWCKWCKMFHQFTATTPSIDSLLKADFIVEQINYSKENKNTELLKQLDFPQRFGFPVFVILDANGKRIHTQNSVYLEEGEGYSEKKVIEFLKHWNRAALMEKNY